MTNGDVMTEEEAHARLTDAHLKGKEPILPPECEQLRRMCRRRDMLRGKLYGYPLRNDFADLERDECRGLEKDLADVLCALVNPCVLTRVRPALEQAARPEPELRAKAELDFSKWAEQEPHLPTAGGSYTSAHLAWMAALGVTDKCPVCNGAGKQAGYGILLGDGTAGHEQAWTFLPCSTCHGSGKSFFAVAAELDEILEDANTKV